MRRLIVNPTSPQQKTLGVSNRFGNKGLKKQQGTTRIIFDSLPHDGRDEYIFFEGVGTRVFPDTNLTGNQLSVGEAMTIERAYIMTFSNVAGVFSNMLTVNGSPDLLGGTFSFNQGNVDIIKPIAIASFSSDFNKDAEHTQYTNFEMDTQLVLQPLLSFTARVRPYDSVTVANEFVRLVIEGAGAILAPRNTF